MRKTDSFPRLLAIAGFIFLAANVAHGQMLASPKSKFTFKDANGKTDSAEIVTKYAPKKIVQPFAKVDPSIDPKLRKAATIAEERAHAHSREQCWHYVKEALLASGAVTSYPKTVNAKDAAGELVKQLRLQKTVGQGSLQGAGWISACLQ